LTYKKFRAEYANLVWKEAFELHKEKAEGAAFQEQASYWQLYKAMNGMEGKYMDMVKEARGLSALS